VRLRDWFGKPPIQIVDPVFGKLTFRDGVWIGKVSFPETSRPVGLDIEADAHGPTDRHRALFRELESKYPGLRQDIGAVLWQLYQPMREHLDRDSGPHTAPDGPTAMEGRTQLDAILLRSHGRIELLFGFVADVGWDDATFRVGLDDFKPVPLSLDD
jgi:hypothetical protein